jgi:hypothetical protein
VEFLFHRRQERRGSAEDAENIVKKRLQNPKKAVELRLES